MLKDNLLSPWGKSSKFSDADLKKKKKKSWPQGHDFGQENSYENLLLLLVDITLMYKSFIQITDYFEINLLLNYYYKTYIWKLDSTVDTVLTKSSVLNVLLVFLILFLLSRLRPSLFTVVYLRGIKAVITCKTSSMVHFGSTLKLNQDTANRQLPGLKMFRTINVWWGLGGARWFFFFYHFVFRNTLLHPPSRHVLRFLLLFFFCETPKFGLNSHRSSSHGGGGGRKRRGEWRKVRIGRGGGGE